MQLQLVVDMDTATIEQIHRLQQRQLKTVERLPELRKLSRDAGLSKSCAYKEFRFPPPFAGKKKEKKGKKLPPIPENMLPRRHNSFEEVDLHEYIPLPSISPTMPSEKDERSLSEAAKPSLENPALFHNVREFTFPVSSANVKNQKKSSPDLSSPRIKDLPIHIKISKLAKRKRKEKARKDRAARYDRGYQPVNDFSFPAREKMNAFQPKRELRESKTTFPLKDNKQLPFKQMSKPSEESEKSHVNPRLYTRIVDSIYSYSKGKFLESDSSTVSSFKRREPFERLTVTPVTVKDVVKDEYNRRMTYLPPLS